MKRKILIAAALVLGISGEAHADGTTKMCHSIADLSKAYAAAVRDAKPKRTLTEGVLYISGIEPNKYLSAEELRKVITDNIFNLDIPYNRYKHVSASSMDASIFADCMASPVDFVPPSFRSRK
ncbi:hypothetical protein ACMHYO_22540 [Allopusillimonas ginsengisoli]|uniref:hypothetical protein n=1 Tax=Allopusillimonas ginsengisoli TaxID=453575 RepID=UPI0039C32528